MDFLDEVIPLFFAILLLTSPQLFTKKPLNSESGEAVKRRLRQIGYVLLGVSVLYAILKFKPF